MGQGHQSVFKLSLALTQYGAVIEAFDARRITDWNKGKSDPPQMGEGWSLTDETYSNRSFIYIQAPDKKARKRLEVFLACKGFHCNPDYSPNSNTTEVRVAYFKGWHWDD